MRSVVTLDDGLEPADVAALADAVLTAYHAVRKAIPLLHTGAHRDVRADGRWVDAILNHTGEVAHGCSTSSARPAPRRTAPHSQLGWIGPLFDAMAEDVRWRWMAVRKSTPTFEAKQMVVDTVFGEARENAQPVVGH